MTRLLTLAAVALAAWIHPAGLAIAAVFIVGVLWGAGLGYHAAVRRSGVGMVRGGVHRITTGRF